MDHSQSRIRAEDSLILFADLQTGIVERTKTIPRLTCRFLFQGFGAKTEVPPG